jgi:hypothetical protein
MPRNYLPTVVPQGNRCEREYACAIPLDGVPQIPDHAVRTMTEDGELALTRIQQSACSHVIWKRATKEIRRRHEALLAGEDLATYWPAWWSMNDDDETEAEPC